MAEIGDNPSNWPVSENIDELVWQGLWDLAFLTAQPTQSRIAMKYISTSPGFPDHC